MLTLPLKVYIISSIFKKKIHIPLLCTIQQFEFVFFAKLKYIQDHIGANSLPWYRPVNDGFGWDGKSIAVPSEAKQECIDQIACKSVSQCLPIKERVIRSGRWSAVCHAHTAFCTCWLECITTVVDKLIQFYLKLSATPGLVMPLWSKDRQDRRAAQRCTVSSVWQLIQMVFHRLKWKSSRFSNILFMVIIV